MLKRTRRGSLLIELGVCTVLLAVLMSVTTQMAVNLRNQSRQAARESAAMLHLENALEQLTAKPWSQITSNSALAASSTNPLPGAVTVTVQESDDPVPSKQVTLELRLNEKSTRRPIRLTTWVYRDATE